VKDIIFELVVILIGTLAISLTSYYNFGYGMIVGHAYFIPALFIFLGISLIVVGFVSIYQTFEY